MTLGNHFVNVYETIENSCDSTILLGNNMAHELARNNPLALVQDPIRRMQEAGMLPRQIAAVIGYMLQSEARGLYATIETEEEFRNAGRVAYDQRDKLVPNPLGFQPTEEDQVLRKTPFDSQQAQTVTDSMAPVMLDIRAGISSRQIDRRLMEAISMSLFAASNDTGISNLRPDDGRDYFAAMTDWSLRYLSQIDGGPRERILLRPATPRMPGS